MVTECRPIRDSGGLPPRRSELIQAAAATVSPELSSGNDWSSSINVPLARDRMLEYFEREQLPGDVKATLAAALHGDLHLQSMLFNAMLDSWPKLQKAIAEISRKVSVAPWKIHPFVIRGEQPSPVAEKQAKEFERLIWGMKPRAARLELGLEDTIKDIVRAYFYGHGVNEIRWTRNPSGEWAPRCTKSVPARFFGYPADYELQHDPEDRLMFNPEGGMGVRRFEDFAENRFLIAIHKGHGGHPTVSAPLRSLTAYWLAAIYGLKWFMNFTQLYGIPWRHAEVGDSKDENAVRNALATIGANGYIVTKPGTKINILSPGATNGASLPQRELIALADQQCDQFILGQTLTSGVSKDGGSRALGEVHQGTLDGVIDGVADFVGGVLTHQFIPAIAAANWGDAISNELPEMWAKREEVKDEKALAERDERIGITSGKVPVGKAWFYERHGIPMPADGDEILIDEASEPLVDPKSPLQMVNLDPNLPVKKPVEAADAGEWVEFPESLGIPRREMPQIASGNRAAMVQFLRARGIESMREKVSAFSLKPTQREYSPMKVKAAKEYMGGNRAILISQDNRVLDGHHQWMASAEENKEIEVVRLMAPIARVLMMAHRMPSTTVAAADASTVKESLTVEQLSTAVLEGLTGVSREWLSPVRPFFDRLAALAMSKQVTDEDFLAALEKAQTQLPEIFELMDSQALEDAFSNAIGSAALAGSVSRYE
jgi:phage gp29-like protein